MPDISMCSNSDCEVRGSCYRFTAKPSEFQSYMLFEPELDGHCCAYIPNVYIKE